MILDLIALTLRAALVAALVGVCLSLYARLPPDDSSVLGSASGGASRETEVKIVLRRGSEESVLSQAIPIEIYSQEAVQTGRESKPAAPGKDPLQRARPGRREIEPFVKTEFDERGQATVQLRPGRWWLRTSLSGPHELTWRLPIDVSSGQPLTVELTPENAYTREKAF
ncbi:MAG: hypothetical protein WKF84_18865 [Pyrinomonadaceae bacterium]